METQMISKYNNLLKECNKHLDCISSNGKIIIRYKSIYYPGLSKILLIGLTPDNIEQEINNINNERIINSTLREVDDIIDFMNERKIYYKQQDKDLIENEIKIGLIQFKEDLLNIFLNRKL